MIDLLENDVNNIICLQPFGCLPNHVVGKGVMKELRRQYPQANIAAIDYDLLFLPIKWGKNSHKLRKIEQFLLFLLAI